MDALCLSILAKDWIEEWQAVQSFLRLQTKDSKAQCQGGAREDGDPFS